MILHVLHLEDEASLREVLRSALRVIDLDDEVQVEQFENSDDAVRHIEDFGPDIDLFILDIRVPGDLDGVGVARLIRQWGCPGVVVLSSAYTEPDEQLLSSLHAEWMPKPWRLDELGDTLMDLLA